METKAKVMYSAYACYQDGSTGERVIVFLNSSFSQKEAANICDTYAKNKKGILRTWLVSSNRVKEYRIKSYPCG